MKKLLLALTLATVASANNPLTEAQLMKAAQLSMDDYARTEPTMTSSVSGFKVTTQGNNAVVIINMDSDGMHMTAKYLCIQDGADLGCHFQE